MVGVASGVVMYGFVVLMAVAGFTVVLPLVILPPVVLGLIAANNLLGGGRTYGRSGGPSVADGQAPLSSSGPNGPRPSVAHVGSDPAPNGSDHRGLGEALPPH
jgi:hypothetical protein